MRIELIFLTILLYKIVNFLLKITCQRPFSYPVRRWHHIGLVFRHRRASILPTALLPPIHLAREGS